MVKEWVADQRGKAHHAAADTWLKVLRHFDPTLPHRVVEGEEEVVEAEKEPVEAEAEQISAERVKASNGLPPMNILGFSATLTRHDGLGLDAAFDEIVFHK